MAIYDIPEGCYEVGDAHFAVIAARFNSTIVDPLLAATLATLERHGVDAARVDVMRVPGAFEIPLAAARTAASGRFAALITLGAVIRGGTPHFDYVAGACTDGVARVALDCGLPVIFGVLTCDDIDQARARAGDDDANKGREAALAALEMVDLLRRIDHGVG